MECEILKPFENRNSNMFFGRPLMIQALNSSSQLVDPPEAGRLIGRRCHRRWQVPPHVTAGAVGCCRTAWIWILSNSSAFVTIVWSIKNLLRQKEKESSTLLWIHIHPIHPMAPANAVKPFGKSSSCPTPPHAAGLCQRTMALVEVLPREWRSVRGGLNSSGYR